MRRRILALLIGAMTASTATVAEAQTLSLPEVHDLYLYGQVGQTFNGDATTVFGAGVEISFASDLWWIGDLALLPEASFGYSQIDGYSVGETTSAGDEVRLEGGIRGLPHMSFYLSHQCAKTRTGKRSLCGSKQARPYVGLHTGIVSLQDFRLIRPGRAADTNDELAGTENRFDVAASTYDVGATVGLVLFDRLTVSGSIYRRRFRTLDIDTNLLQEGTPDSLDLSSWSINLSLRVPINDNDEEKSRAKATLLYERAMNAKKSIGPAKQTWFDRRFATCDADYVRGHGRAVSDADWATRCAKVVEKLEAKALE